VAVRRGVIVVIVLIFIAVAISTAGLLVMGLAVGRTPQIASNSTLLLNVGGDLQEVEPSGVIGQFLEAPPTVRSVVDALRKASIDRRVTSVIIRPTNSAALWGKVQEVREAIVEFKKSKKPIIAYLEFGGDQNYYLASACDKVFLMPTASLDLTGIASYELFLRGALDKMGVVPDSLHVGDYKTASNTFTEHTFTPAHREMAQSLNSDLYGQLIDGLAEGRHRTASEMRTLIDHGPYLPEDAVRAGLVDDLAYEDEIDDKVVLGSGRTRMLKQQEYRAVGLNSLGLNRGPRIALIYAVGTITSGTSSDSPSGQSVGSDTIVDYLRKARADTSIRAIVLRIDSPGGSAVASDVIWREIMLTRDQKPVIASMSDVAASGGYYIAMPAHAIVAQPATLTGSIGVVMIRFVIDGTLDKVGLNLETVKSGKYADLFSPVRPFTPDERKKVGELMQATYDSFVEKAAAGRNTTPERIDAIAQGRVWTGKQAKELGLVDELGGLDKALALAKERAKIAASSEVELVVFPPKKSLFDVVSEPLNRSDGSAALTSLLGSQNARALEAVTSPLRMFRRGEPLTLMPNVFCREQVAIRRPAR
jgi:protease-4